MEPSDRRLILAGVGLAGVAALSRLAKAGPLDPPPGPVEPTGRTLNDLYDKVARTDAGLAEPRIPVQSLPGSGTAVHVIDQPGSYYLTGNVAGATGKHGIEIRSSDVTLDLAGFALQGRSDALHGITAGGYSGIRVFNGDVGGWGGDGVQLGYGCLAESVRAASNGGYGIRIASGVVNGCSARSNSLGGFSSAGASFVQCRAEGCGVGFFCSFGSALHSCVADGNAAGYYVEQDSAVVACVARNSTDQGYVVRTQARAINCESYGHATGFLISEGVCDGCHASRGTSEGFYAGPGARALITRCVASGNTTNFALSGGNSYGPIVDVAAAGDISAIPNAGHPWANFAY
ncbi:MAG: hypothetical protein AMXMBFR58_25380 [Phycisphaerae bacterium]